jgi:eukaryotic-like serine/threonine-protein kinase
VARCAQRRPPGRHLQLGQDPPGPRRRGRLPGQQGHPAGAASARDPEGDACAPQQRYTSVAEFYAAFEAAVAAPDQPWEDAEATAQRLLERVRLPKAAPADLDELFHWALILDENDYDDIVALSRVLPWISARSIRYLWGSDQEGFWWVFSHYSRHVETGNFSFDYCDVLADFSRKAVAETADTHILRDAIVSLVELGYAHNRWHVRGVVTAMLQSIRETEHTLAASEALRTADPEAVEWTLSEFSIRSLPPALRVAIENLRATTTQPSS